MNRKFLFFLAALITSLGVIFLFRISVGKSETFNESGERNEEMKRNKFAPYEYFQMARNYPDFTMDEKGFRQALIQLQSKRLQYAKNGELNKAWTIEGPTNIGGCITCIAVHPTDTSIIYIGSVYGGIYKTINGGTTWKPVFDSVAYLSIGAITIDKNNPNIMYAGTGDPNVDGSGFTGNGIYKSTDGGETWAHRGLDSMGIVSKIVIHPSNNQVIYAAAMGRPMTRGLNRGLYRSVDGGTTWNNILSLGNETGVMDVIIDKNNPNTIYATGMRRIRTNQESIITGTTTRIYKSTDNGSTWNILVNGLPSGAWCKVNIDMHPSNTNILYASVVDTTLDLRGIYTSVNGGTTWTAVDTTGIPADVFNGFGWYFAQIRINPFNTSELFLQGVDLWHSTNGGLNWSMAGPPWYTNEVHADKHAMHFLNATQYLLATDGGLYKTPDAGQTWTFKSNIPITQFYHVAVNYWDGNYYGGAQDNGTLSGTAASLDNWNRTLGGDGFKPSFSSNYPDLKYAETQNGKLYYNTGGGFYQDASIGFDSNDVPNWDMPYFLSRFNDHVFAGTQFVYKASDCTSPSFYKISPDLTDGNIYGAHFHNISTLCESFTDQNNLYAGTSDANVWRSENNGSTWTNITGSLPDRYVTCVTTSYKNANTVYVAHSGYKYDEYIPHIHKSIDNGTTWIDISGDLPQFAVNNILTFSFDENTLMVGTDGGVFCTRNGGINWTRVGNNMPVFPVYDLAYDTINKKVIAGTYARSIMSYDFGLPTSGLNELSQNISAVDIYPNPAENMLYIQHLNSKSVSATVYDLKGEMMIQNTHSGQIDISTLNTGIYLLYIDDGTNKPLVRKFMKH